jgi:hypothetical protein
VHAGTVLRFKFKEGQNLSEVYFREIRDSLGGREGGVTYVEYNKAGSLPHRPCIDSILVSLSGNLDD